MSDWHVQAPGPLHEPDMTLLADWAREHGVEPTEVRYAETDVIDIPLVRFEVYERDFNGNLLVRDNECVMRWIEVALRRPPPVPSDGPARPAGT